MVEPKYKIGDEVYMKSPEEIEKLYPEHECNSGWMGAFLRKHEEKQRITSVETYHSEYIYQLEPLDFFVDENMIRSTPTDYREVW